MIAARKRNGFRHEALFYADEDDFLAGTVPFVRAGVETGEPVLVALGPIRTRALAGELGRDADRVQFADMLAVGRNPARIIPVWRDFVEGRDTPDRPVRGIGEPIWAGRTPPELAECRHHESLLNLAFAEAEEFRLLCPYDVSALEGRVLHEAQCTHPWITEADVSRPSEAYLAPDLAPGPFEGDLRTAPADAHALDFDGERLSVVRDLVSDEATRAGLGRMRRGDLVLAVSEVSTNSVLHAGGRGTLRIWRDGNTLLCEVSDRGRLRDPLLGRQRPAPGWGRGRGLWLVNRVCDLVQMRSSESGTVVRLHMGLDPSS